MESGTLKLKDPKWVPNSHGVDLWKYPNDRFYYEWRRNGKLMLSMGPPSMIPLRLIGKCDTAEEAYDMMHDYQLLLSLNPFENER